MPKFGEMFPSNFLKAEDLEDDELTVTIKKITQETIGTDDKWVVHFKGRDKGLVLNKTNADTIQQLYGDDSDDWIGKTVTLFPTKVAFNGKNVDAIRVKATRPKAKAAKTETPQPAASAANGDDSDDNDTPF